MIRVKSHLRGGILELTSSTAETKGVVAATIFRPLCHHFFNLKPQELTMMGVDIRNWYDEMPKTLRIDEVDEISLSPRKVKALDVLNKLRIEDHLVRSRCLTCNSPTASGTILKAFQSAH